MFDTALPDLNLVQLFRTNRYVGPDRLSDANQLAAGITTRLLDARGGRQYLSATIGQAYYFDDPRVRLPDEPESSRGNVRRRGRARDDGLSRTGARDSAIRWDPGGHQGRQVGGRRCSTGPRSESRRQRRLSTATRPDRAVRRVGRLADQRALARLRTLGLLDARRKDAGPVRRSRVRLMLLGPAARDPALRQQPHRRYRYLVSACSWNSGDCPVSESTTRLSCGARFVDTPRVPTEPES